MADKPRHLLSGYAAEILDRDERRDLMAAALEDQDVFDRLVEEESWRRILSVPGVRRELLEALDDPGPLAKLLDLLSRPAVRWVGATAAAGVLAAVLLPHVMAPGAGTPVDPETELVAKGSEFVPKSVPSTTRSLSNEPSEPLSASAVPSPRDVVYGLELETPEGSRSVPLDHAFEPDDQFRIRFETDFPAWIYLFNRSKGDEAYSVVYPAREEEHAARQGRIHLPPGGAWWRMDETPEDEELVVLVASAPWSGFEPGRLTVASTELEATLARAEDQLKGLSWRRSSEGDRVRYEIAAGEDELFFMARLF